jgi:hypothetical protein
MDVADLLELERALERRGVRVAAPDEHEPARVHVPAREVGDPGLVLERASRSLGQRMERRTELQLLFGA